MSYSNITNEIAANNNYWMELKWFIGKWAMLCEILLWPHDDDIFCRWLRQETRFLVALLSLPSLWNGKMWFDKLYNRRSNRHKGMLDTSKLRQKVRPWPMTNATYNQIFGSRKISLLINVSLWSWSPLNAVIKQFVHSSIIDDYLISLTMKNSLTFCWLPFSFRESRYKRLNTMRWARFYCYCIVYYRFWLASDVAGLPYGLHASIDSIRPPFYRVIGHEWIKASDMFSFSWTVSSSALHWRCL